ncbi:MAG: HAD family hydrolase [Candidatus Pacearchaeota archaeon]
MKIAVFDFCKTLVNMNTLSSFVEFVLEKEKNILIKIIKKFIFVNRKILNRIFFVKPRYIEIFLLRGYSKDFLASSAKEFINTKIIINKNAKILEYLLELKNKGYVIIILSAALDIYLSFVKDIFNADYVICTNLKFKNDICLGKVDGIDAYGKKKIEKLLKEFPYSDYIDWEKSFYFTDDYITELDVLNKFGHKYIVVNKLSKLNNLINQNIYKIIYI